MAKKVYVIGMDEGVTKWLKSRGNQIVNIQNPVETAEALDNPDVVVFTGGSDVWPALYGAKNTDSGCNIARDINEIIWFHRFFRTPKVGICRGGQFLNVMSGGGMKQDHPHHALAGTHKISCRVTGDNYFVTSTHHQLMIPGGAGMQLAWAKDMPDRQNTSEVVWYGSTTSLCFQPHPEYGVGAPGNQTITCWERYMNHCFGFTI